MKKRFFGCFLFAVCFVSLVGCGSRWESRWDLDKVPLKGPIGCFLGEKGENYETFKITPYIILKDIYEKHPSFLGELYVSAHNITVKNDKKMSGTGISISYLHGFSWREFAPPGMYDGDDAEVIIWVQSPEEQKSWNDFLNVFKKKAEVERKKALSFLYKKIPPPTLENKAGK